MRLTSAFFSFFGAFICIVLMMPASNFAVTIEADNVRSTGDIVRAFGNVELQHKDQMFKMDRLVFNQDLNQLSGTGNVFFQQLGLDPYYGDSIFYDVDKEVMRLSGFKNSKSFSNESQRLRFYAETIEIQGDEVKGQDGVFTTCSLEHPHYTLNAKKFHMVKNQHIEGESVQLTTFLSGVVPFGFWVPYYRYEIGSRNTVWNIPVFGKKNTPGWGWFVQNTIDYGQLNGKNSSVLLDLFENKGVGLGVTHQYKWWEQDGTISYYRLEEQDTKRLNERFLLQDHFVWGSKDVTLGYEWGDAERLNSTGRQQYERKSVSVIDQYLGSKYDWNYLENDDRALQFSTRTFLLKHQFNTIDQYQFSLNQRESKSIKRRDTEAVFMHFLELPEASNFNTKFRYLQLTQSGSPANTLLESDFKYSRQISTELSFLIWVDTLSDLDGDRVENDVFFNRFFYRIPEIKLTHKGLFQGWSTDHSLVVARYQEADVVGGRILRVFPNAGGLSYAPNTLIWNQNISRSVGEAKVGGAWQMGIDYEQFLFSFGGRDFLSSDAMYSLGGTLSFDRDFGGLRSQTSFVRVFSPLNNNSPFLYFQKRTLARQLLSETVTLYGTVGLPYDWSHQTAFDWEAQRWEDYRTKLSFFPGSKWVSSISTGKKLSPRSFDFQQDYLSTQFSSQLEGGELWKFNYTIGFDTNEWVYRKANLIQYSYLAFGFPFGDARPEYQWALSTSLEYNTVGSPRGFDPSRYEFQTIMLSKRDHCQRFSLSYNRLSQEFGFQFSIDAFPEDPLDLNIGGQGMRFGGRLNSSSEERF